MEYYISVLKNYALFEGRARRKEYWMFTLINFLISMALGVAGGFIGAEWISSIYGLAVLVPGIAVAVRRLHDVGKSGWWILIAFTIIGAFYLLYLYVQEGDAGENEYGSDPKAEEAEAF